MDEIQTYRGMPATPSTNRFAPGGSVIHPVPAGPAPVKSSSDYLRALRRRIWMVLAVSVPLAILGCIVALRLPPVYQVKAEVEINPPEYDEALSALVSHNIGQHENSSKQRYIPARAAQLKSQRLLQKTISSPELASEMSQFDDPITELFTTLNVTQPQRNGNIFVVTLEGRDAFRTKRLLEVLLQEFKDDAKKEIETKMFQSGERAEDNLKQLRGQLADLKKQIIAKLKTNHTLGAGGKSIIEERYASVTTMLNNKQMRLGELNQQLLMMQSFPRMDQNPDAARRASQIATLETERRHWTELLASAKKRTRNFNSDPFARTVKEKLESILDELDALTKLPDEVRLSPNEMILDQYKQEIEADKQEQAKLLHELRESLPADQEVLDMMQDSDEKSKRISDMEVKLAEFRILADTLTASDFVIVPSSIPEPLLPIKPNRPLLIVASLILSLAAGIGLVCMLEHLDHSVKVPEHVSHGLTLPLLGVVPRIRRTALTQRGSHLWTPGAPETLATDAYRNIRASLLGVADRRGPIVTLLVTSAKAGDGKSTTALNLAATCALAGERTLLLDIDLRRPCLADVFIEDEDAASAPGIADVLKGELPWQRTLQHTRIPNLDFIPSGDTRDTPIEILGSLELRQLLKALSHHYDRVILDGPAVLGLADCRFLGRIVDASLLVVKAGSHQLTTLHRAKAMLEQSHVAIAGIVFNGLTEDIENWSSYQGDYGLAPAGPRAVERARGVEDLAFAGQA